MLTKAEVNFVKKLHSKKEWLNSSYFLCEGLNIVKEILRSDFIIKHIYTTKKTNLNFNQYTKVVKIVNIDDLKILSLQSSPPEILAIVQKKHFILDNLNPDNWLIFLENIQDPGNLGTMIRIADWFSIKNIVLSPHCANLYNPKTIQSSMGSFVRLNIFKGTWEELNNKFPNMPLYGTALNGINIFNFHQKIIPGIIAFGSEGQGLSLPLLNKANKIFTIPKLGQAESLNVAVACGIIMSKLCFPNPVN